MVSGQFIIDRRLRARVAAGLRLDRPEFAGVPDPGQLVGLFVRCLGGLASTAAAWCGGVLALRRLTTSMTDVPGPGVLLAVAVSGAVLVVAADAGRRQGGGLLGPVAARIGLALALAAVFAPPPTVAGWVALSPAVATALVATLRWTRAAEAAPGRSGPRPDPASRSPHRSRPKPARESTSPGRRRTREPRRTRQRFERYELSTGTDCLRGRITIAVPAGAKSAHGHVGFCPAFGETPRVAVTTDYDGVEATVLAAEVLPWGVRVECRLAEPAEEPLEIPVDLVANAPAPA